MCKNQAPSSALRRKFPDPARIAADRGQGVWDHAGGSGSEELNALSVRGETTIDGSEKPGQPFRRQLPRPQSSKTRRARRVPRRSKDLPKLVQEAELECRKGILASVLRKPGCFPMAV